MNTPFPNYTKPHDTLTQNLDHVSVAAVNRMNSVLIGTQYLLNTNDGRDLVSTAFAADGAEQELAYQYLSGASVMDLNLTNYAVDLDSVQLIADGLEAVISGEIAGVSAESNRRLRFGDVIFKTGDSGTLAAELNDRSIQVGDIIEVKSTDDQTKAKARVTGYLAKLRDPIIGDVILPGAPFAAVVSPPQGAYSDLVDNTLVISVLSVVNNTVTISVYDTAGRYPIVSHSFNKTVGVSDIMLGESGLTIDLPISPDYAAGQTFSVSVTDAGVFSDQFDGVTTDAPVFAYGNDGDTFTVKVIQRVSGPLTKADNTANGLGTLITPTADKVTYDADNLGVTVGATFYAFTKDVGSVKLAYRAALQVDAAEGVLTVAPGDDTTVFGENKPDNDLAHGVAAMRVGAGNNAFFVVRTSADTVEALQAALLKLRSHDKYYAMALLTDNADVGRAFRDDILTQSSSTVMKWRKGYIGVDSPDDYELWGALESGGYRKATMFNGIITVEDADKAHGDFLTAGVRAGDKIRFLHLPTAYTVSGIQPGVNGESWQLSIVESVADIALPSSFVVIKPANPANVAQYVKSKASDIGGAVADGRLTVLWSDKPESGLSAGVLKGKYLAAWMAGLRCNLLPQQGVATFDVPVIESAPSMHTQFTSEILSDMAASGVMVVTQDAPDAPVYILDQVTTCTTKGLLKFQDNCLCIVDSFSYAIKDGQVGLRGRKNATKVTADAVRNATQRTAIEYAQVTLAEYKTAGPRIMAFYNRDGVANQVTVERSPNIVNRLSTYIEIDIPVPLNGIDNVIRASVGTTF